MPWNFGQYKTFLDDLGLNYKINTPEEGASTIVVEDGKLEFKPYSCTLRKDGKTVTQSPTQTFKKECKLLAKS